MEYALDQSIVRKEVMAPVGDAVRFVDHDERDPVGNFRQHFVTEAFVGESLERNEEYVDDPFAVTTVNYAPLPAAGAEERRLPNSFGLGATTSNGSNSPVPLQPSRRPQALRPSTRDGVETVESPCGCVAHRRW